MTRRLGEHNIATCERMISRRVFGSKREAESWITRTDGSNYIHQIRLVSPMTANGRYEVKYCLPDTTAGFARPGVGRRRPG